MKEVDYMAVAEKAMNQIKQGAFLTVRAGEALNTMTIGWATIGYVWRKPVFMVLVRDSRHTFGIIEKAADFTVSVPIPHSTEPSCSVEPNPVGIMTSIRSAVWNLPRRGRWSHQLSTRRVFILNARSSSRRPWTLLTWMRSTKSFIRKRTTIPSISVRSGIAMKFDPVKKRTENPN
jgi:aminoglycoside phosphotransferase (APT) family kinase protein